MNKARLFAGDGEGRKRREAAASVAVASCSARAGNLSFNSCIAGCAGLGALDQNLICAFPFGTDAKKREICKRVAAIDAEDYAWVAVDGGTQ